MTNRKEPNPAEPKKLKIKDKLLAIPKDVIKNMTLGEISKHIEYVGTTNALRVTIGSLKIQYKRANNVSEFVRKIKASGVDTPNMTIEQLVDLFRFEGNIKTLQTLLWKNNVAYRRVLKSSLGFEQLSKMNTEDKTVQELMELIGYEKNASSFITTARKYGIKHKPYTASESDILYLVKKFIELDAWEMKPSEFFKAANYPNAYNPSFMVKFIKKKIAQDEEFSKLQKP